ncbi:MAG TPA: tRNA (adenosine(37)-N6)-threonylcarbamoyltransferase complex transferase subunit TsaD [Candidatus Paceibacterota bacterium]|nr:tRNA (adenosine(37)-N6)-threonylcarbamoyltransferase complex transferase subunit TsaD [Candidatus Paceibacterota bacterium]
MRILAIETSCDETATAIVHGTGSIENPVFSLISQEVFSQADLHTLYGGVLPNLARREHGQKIIPLVTTTIEKVKSTPIESTEITLEHIKHILLREPEVYDAIISNGLYLLKPEIDAIAVTQGPGLEPALWVGINTARALALLWNIPLIPTNHMEGHIISPLLKAPGSPEVQSVAFPAIALLISGGHTELVLTPSWGLYTTIGRTRDDALGEAFDKVARLLSLPYPGGALVSKLAKEARSEGAVPQEHGVHLPRPMIHSKDFDFSFSGIKTAVLYLIRDLTKTGELTDTQKKAIACEFENAVSEVITSKTKAACIAHSAKSLIVGGGVIANDVIRERLETLGTELGITVLLPTRDLSTDNAPMIAMAGYIRALEDRIITPNAILETVVKAEGNLSY